MSWFQRFEAELPQSTVKVRFRTVNVKQDEGGNWEFPIYAAVSSVSAADNDCKSTAK
jgi:hypothetical protein